MCISVLSWLFADNCIPYPASKRYSRIFVRLTSRSPPQSGIWRRLACSSPRPPSWRSLVRCPPSASHSRPGQEKREQQQVRLLRLCHHLLAYSSVTSGALSATRTCPVGTCITIHDQARSIHIMGKRYWASSDYGYVFQRPI